MNCTELKPKLVLKYVCCVNVFAVAGLIVLCGMACRSVFCYRYVSCIYAIVTQQCSVICTHALWCDMRHV